MSDKRIIFNENHEMVLTLKNKDISDFAYILGLFLEYRKSYSVDSTSEDLAEKWLKEMPEDVINEIKRYHGDNFFGIPPYNKV